MLSITIVITLLLNSCDKQQEINNDMSVNTPIIEAQPDNPAGFEISSYYSEDNFKYGVTSDNRLILLGTVDAFEELNIKSEDLGLDLYAINANAFEDSEIKSLSVNTALMFSYESFLNSKVEYVTIHDSDMITSDTYYSGKFNSYVFKDCVNLKTFVLSGYYTELGYGMFENDLSLTTVAISSPIVEIPDNCFYGCSKLKDIYLPATIRNISDTTFEDVSRDCVFHGYSNTWLENWVKNNGYKWDSIE